MKVKIVSDGSPFGSKVINAETGELVRGVKSAVITLTPDGSTVDLEISGVDIDATSLSARFLAFHPVTKQMEEVEQIVFKDGTIRGFA